MVGVLPLLAQDTRLIDFSIEDQFGSIHIRAEYNDRLVVVIGSDQGGSQFNPLWGAAIHDALGSHPDYASIGFLAVADVSSVPFFLKGIVVKRMFPSEQDRWVLMDWDGLFADTYDFRPDSTNILVFNRLGRLVLHEQGREVQVHTIQAIVKVLTDLLY